MGININVPNTIQQNTPLRGVRSGATGGDEDNNVKYVPQSLTDAQKAQARQNIGAAAEGQGGEQIQSDWDQTDTAAVDYIKNKPTIPAAQVNADWNASSGVAQILNKPTIPAAQIQSDWNQSDTTALDYIKNKPEISDPFPFFGNNKMLIIKSDRQTTFTTASGKFLDIWRNGVYEHLGSASDNIRSVTISGGINYIKFSSIFGEGFADKKGNYVLYTPSSNSPLGGTYTGSMKMVQTGTAGDIWHQSEQNGVTHFLLRNYALMDRIGLNTFTYVFTDKDFTKVKSWPGTIPSTVLATFYVPRNRYNEFVNLVNTQYPNDDTSVILNKVIIYDFIEWIDFEPIIKTYNAVPLTMTDANGNVITGDFIVYNLSITPAV